MPELSKDSDQTLYPVTGVTGVILAGGKSRRFGKNKAFAELDGICKDGAIIASNTSVLPLVEMAIVTKRPDKVIGLHFFNPASAMKLVEIVKPITVSDETVETCKAFIESVGKTPVVLPDTPGFIVNRLAVGFMLNAMYLLENGVATKEDIDTSWSPESPLVYSPVRSQQLPGYEA